MKYKTLAILEKPLEMLEMAVDHISTARGRRKHADYSVALNFLLEKCLLPKEEVLKKLEEKYPESTLNTFEDVAERVRIFTQKYREVENVE